MNLHKLLFPSKHREIEQIKILYLELNKNIANCNASKIEYYNKYTQLKKSIKMHIAKGVKAELTKLNKNKK